jgi:hypothetical protein
MVVDRAGTIRFLLSGDMSGQLSGTLQKPANWRAFQLFPGLEPRAAEI